MKVVVVGGGISGLVAALKLARSGAEVRLLEKSDELGGRGRSPQMSGAIVNLGPHAIYNGAGGRRILSDLGVEITGGSPVFSEFDLVVDGALVPAPSSPWKTAGVDYLSWSEKAGIARFFAAVFTQRPCDWESRPVGELFDSIGATPNLARVLSMITTISTYASSERLSAAAAMRQARISLANVTYPDGGWQRIVDRLAERARAAGVEVDLASRIVDATFPEADAVVLAVPPDEVERLTGVDFGPRRPTRMATLDVVLDNPPRAPRNTFDVDASCYLSFHSPLAQLGTGFVLHCAKYLDPYAEHEPKRVRGELEGLLDRAQPGWRDHVREVRYLPKLVVNHWFPAAEIGGQAGRPSVRLDERTWIAGDWVGAEGMLVDAAIHSAHAAARDILSSVSSRTEERKPAPSRAPRAAIHA